MMIKDLYLASEVNELLLKRGHRVSLYHCERLFKEELKEDENDLVIIKDWPELLSIDIPKIFYTTYSVLFTRDIRNSCVFINRNSDIINEGFLHYAVQYLAANTLKKIFPVTIKQEEIK